MSSILFFQILSDSGIFCHVNNHQNSNPLKIEEYEKIVFTRMFILDDDSKADNDKPIEMNQLPAKADVYHDLF